MTESERITNYYTKYRKEHLYNLCKMYKNMISFPNYPEGLIKQFLEFIKKEGYDECDMHEFLMI